MERLTDIAARRERGSPGVDYARQAIALALSNGRHEAIQRATESWGAHSATVIAMKSAVAGGATDDPEHSALAGTQLGEIEFVEVIRPLEIPGALQLRAVPANVRIVMQADGATAFWTEEGKAAPLSRTAFERTALKPLRVPVLLVYSNETLQYAARAVEQMVLADMRRADIRAVNTAFIDRTNAGIAERIPRSINYDAPSFTSTGSIANDIAGAIEIFEGDLSAAAWVMHPTLAVRIGLSFGLGSAARVGARGGELAGLPVVTSEACNLDSSGGVITLLDASAVCVADTGIEVRRSRDAVVEMDDEPTGDTMTPAAASAHLVSLFQSDAVGILLSRRVNWLVARTNAVVCVTNCLYEGS